MDQAWLWLPPEADPVFIPSVLTHNYRIGTMLSLIANSILSPWSEKFVHDRSVSQALPFLCPWLSLIPSYWDQGTEELALSNYWL